MRWKYSSCRFLSLMGVRGMPRPVYKYHSLSWCTIRVPLCGFDILSVNRVAKTLVLIHDDRVLSMMLIILLGVALGLYTVILCPGISNV